MRTTIPGFTRRRKHNTTGFKYFCFGVNYDNCPDTYDYFFKAESAEDVSRATGVDLEYIYPCTMADLTLPMPKGRGFLLLPPLLSIPKSYTMSASVGFIASSRVPHGTYDLS